MATSSRGFGSMDKARQKEIASMGGKASGKKSRSTGSNSAKSRGAAGRTEAAKRGGQH